MVQRSISTSVKPAPNAAKSNARPTPGDVNAEWTHDLHSLNNPTASRLSQLSHHVSKQSRANRNERLHNALNGSPSSPALTSQFNIVGTKKPSTQISIRGLAGPYVVMAKNFVPGTTVADIESAVTPVGGVTLSCRIITERPSVIAEIIFESKEGADNVVETFNNQNVSFLFARRSSQLTALQADGNILHVYHKIGGPAPKLPAAQSSPIAPLARSTTPLGPRADILADRSDGMRSGHGGSDRYVPRARSRERRRDYDSRDEVTDGSYGFEDRMDTDDHDNQYEKGRGRGGLYSDTMVNNRGRGRLGKDRGRGYR